MSSPNSNVTANLGEKINIDSDPTTGMDTVAELKSKIYQQCGVPVEKQVLSLNGVVLKDNVLVSGGAQLELEFLEDGSFRSPATAAAAAATNVGSTSGSGTTTTAPAAKSVSGVTATTTARTFLRSKPSRSASNVDAKKMMPPPPPQRPIITVVVDEDDDDDWLYDED